MGEDVAGLLPGWTVRLLSGESARQEFPDLFIEDDGAPYFNELAAHGNARWEDYWPDLVLVVLNPAGEVAVASNASEWHMRDLGALT